MKTISAHFESLPAINYVDFSEEGECELQKLPRAQYLGGQFLARNWSSIPHVTHNDEASIESLQLLRAELKSSAGTAPSFPAYLAKACAVVLKEFPKFNASLDESGKKIYVKQYYNIGIATDTENGLLVPVVKNVDQKSLQQLSSEISDLASRARDKGLPMSDMSAGTFTISSIGNLGGTSFTPIINAPEVAILGVTKSFKRPVQGPNGEVLWETYIPFSLSYDHRVINGADAAKFLSKLAEVLAKPELL